MRSRTFRRFVAIFVGIILAAALTVTIVTGDEKMLGMTLAVGGIYVVYLILMFKKEKEYKASEKKQTKSPLMRR